MSGTQICVVHSQPQDSFSQTISPGPHPVRTSVERPYTMVSVSHSLEVSNGHSLLIIHDWKSGVLTIGDTPQAAMAGIASCMAASGIRQKLPFSMKAKLDDIPSILPCSQSTHIQSGFDLANALETLVPGNICQIP